MNLRFSLAHIKLVGVEGTCASIVSPSNRNAAACWQMEFSTTGALMPNVSGKILVYKLWGVGYQRFDTNEHDKTKKCT